MKTDAIFNKNVTIMFLMLLVVVLFFQWSHESFNLINKPSSVSLAIEHIDNTDISEFTSTPENRNSDYLVKRMSKLLNEAMQNIGQLSCNISSIEVSQNGGWCSKISGMK